MKYYTKNKKPLNYFERQKQESHPKKYRHYFLPDYLYYCGERWRCGWDVWDGFRSASWSFGY